MINKSTALHQWVAKLYNDNMNTSKIVGTLRNIQHIITKLILS